MGHYCKNRLKLWGCWLSLTEDTCDSSFTTASKKNSPNLLFSTQKISSSNNNLERELSSRIYICHYQICVNQGACGCFCTCHSCFSFFPQRMTLDVQAGWKAIMRDKTMPKASLRLKVFFQIGQIFHLLPQLWKHVLELHILLAVAAELSVVAAACHQRVTCRQALRHSITSHGG